MGKSKKANAKAAPAVPVGAAKSEPQPKKKSQAKAATPMHMYCECLADPGSSGPCRMPDQYVSVTNAAKVVDTFLLTSDANGDVCVSIGPTLIRARATHAIAAGVAGARTDVQHESYTELSTQYAYGRMLVYEVEINYIGPAQTAAGRLVLVQESELASYTTSLTLSTAFDDGHSGRAVDGKIARIYPRHEMDMANVASTSFGIPNFDYSIVVGMGLPISSTCMEVRVTRHLEFVPRRNSVLRGSAQAEPFNPTAMAAAANMGLVRNVGVASERNHLTDLARHAASATWQYVQPELKVIGNEIVKYGAAAARDALVAMAWSG